MSDRKMISTKDTIGRHWTMVVTPAVAGFRWKLYVHNFHESEPDVLEAIHPSGVTTGWSEADELDAGAWMIAIMGLFGAERGPTGLCTWSADS